MSIRAVVLVAVATLLPLAGCGAASKSGSTPPTAPAPTAASATQTAPPQTPGTASSTATAKPIPSSNGSASAILPASFVIAANGAVSPPLVAGPVDTTIELIVSSRASHPVTVTVASHSLSVPPNGHATTRLAGLKAGRYAITANGARRAVLVIGTQPGP